MSTPYALQQGKLEQIRARITGRDPNTSPEDDLLDSRALIEAVDFLHGQAAEMSGRIEELETNRQFSLQRRDNNAWVRAFMAWLRGIAPYRGSPREGFLPEWIKGYRKAFRAGWRACER